MELLQTIALLCQVATANPSILFTGKMQLECQQQYIHCVSVKTNLNETEALKRCILEKKSER